MQNIISGNGFILINGRRYEGGTLEMRPFGTTGTRVTIVRSDGTVFSGIQDIDRFTIDGSAPANRTALLAWAADHFGYCSTGSGSVVTTPPAPTNLVIDATARTANFTNSTGIATTGHEYNINGAGWQTVSSKPFPIGNGAINAGALQVRSKAVSGQYNASAVLANGSSIAAVVSVTPKVYFLQTTTGTNPTPSEILAGTAVDITTGANYTLTIPNIGARFMWVSEELTEPVKANVNDTTGDAAINDENAFGTILTIGGRRVYKTNYATASDLPLTFKI